MRNLRSLSDSMQVCLVPYPNSQISVVLGQSFSVKRNGLCKSKMLNTLDTTVSIQRLRKLGYSLSMKTEFDETPNLKKHRVKQHTQKKMFLKKINELKSLNKICSMRSETDDGLSSCSNFPEYPSSDELDSNKPVLTEIDHLKCNIGKKSLSC